MSALSLPHLEPVWSGWPAVPWPNIAPGSLLLLLLLSPLPVVSPGTGHPLLAPALVTVPTVQLITVPLLTLRTPQQCRTCSAQCVVVVSILTTESCLELHGSQAVYCVQCCVQWPALAACCTVHSSNTLIFMGDINIKHKQSNIKV